MDQKRQASHLAEKISDIFNPYYSSAPFFLVVAIFATESLVYGLLWWLVLAGFFSLLPMLDIKRRIRSGRIQDIHVSRREDRIRPFLFSLASALVGLGAVYLFGAPAIIKAVCWVVVLNGALITATTALWKISLHAAGITTIATVLLIAFPLLGALAALCVPLVWWARLTLNRHTPAQLVAGSAVGIAVTVLVFWGFGLI